MNNNGCIDLHNETIVKLDIKNNEDEFEDFSAILKNGRWETINIYETIVNDVNKLILDDTNKNDPLYKELYNTLNERELNYEKSLTYQKKPYNEEKIMYLQTYTILRYLFKKQLKINNEIKTENNVDGNNNNTDLLNEKINDFIYWDENNLLFLPSIIKQINTMTPEDIKSHNILSENIDTIYNLQMNEDKKDSYDLSDSIYNYIYNSPNNNNNLLLMHLKLYKTIGNTIDYISNNREYQSMILNNLNKVLTKTQFENKKLINIIQNYKYMRAKILTMYWLGICIYYMTTVEFDDSLKSEIKNATYTNDWLEIVNKKVTNFSSDYDFSNVSKIINCNNYPQKTPMVNKTFKLIVKYLTTKHQRYNGYIFKFYYEKNKNVKDMDVYEPKTKKDNNGETMTDIYGMPIGLEPGYMPNSIIDILFIGKNNNDVGNKTIFCNLENILRRKYTFIYEIENIINIVNLKKNIILNPNEKLAIQSLANYNEKLVLTGDDESLNLTIVKKDKEVSNGLGLSYKRTFRYLIKIDGLPENINYDLLENNTFNSYLVCNTNSKFKNTYEAFNNNANTITYSDILYGIGTGDEVTSKILLNSDSGDEVTSKILLNSDSSANQPLSKNQIIGIVVGTVVTLIVLVVLIVLVTSKKNKKKAKPKPKAKPKQKQKPKRKNKSKK